MPKQKDGQVSGQWLLAKDGGYVHCSHCGYEPLGTPTPFCPNCGTKMNKEKPYQRTDTAICGL